MSYTGLALLSISATLAGAYVALSRLRDRNSAGIQVEMMPTATLVYRVSKPWRIFLISFGLFIVVGALVAALVWSNSFFTRGAGWGVSIVVCLTVGALLGAYLVIDAQLSKLSMHGDVGEVCGLSGTRRFRREDFSSRFVLTHNGVQTLVCIPKDASQRHLKLQMLFASNDEVQAWFSSIPNLESASYEALRSKIAADATLGATPDVRLGHLTSARKRAVAARWISLGVGAWAWFVPRPYSLAIAVLIAIPWVAVYMAGKSPRLFTLNGSMKDRRPDLSTPLLFPGLILLLRAIRDLNVVDWERAALWAILGTAALAAAAIRVDPELRSRRAAAFTLTILLGSYGYGATLLTNALSERATPTTFTVLVRGKYVASGKTRTPELRLDPWGPIAGARDVAVTWSVYNASVVGGVACVELHSGILRVEWYRVGGEEC